MSLKAYQRKRKFDVTSEPSGERPVRQGQRFVVQKHAASRLHYDFRLEVGGVLKSWAVPHGPSLDPTVKSLAVEVEDHPVDYADFEGTIPAGQYGGGTVMVWDRGTWEPYDEEDLESALKRGKASFRLHGEKLNGAWTLVRMRQRGEKNWLLIKKQDEYAVSRKQNDILVTASRSVLTGRDLSQIADNEKPVLDSKKRVAKQAKATSKNKGDTKADGGQRAASSRRAKSAKAGAKKIAEHLRDTPLADDDRLDNFRPQLATLSSSVPEGDQWLHELKLDGYRILGRIKDGKVQLITRRGLDWSDHFPRIADAVAELPIDNAILDGEVVALDERGVSDFQRLQNWMTQDNQAALVYYVFDLPFAEKHDLTGLPLVERKKILAQVMQQYAPGNDGIIRFHDHIVGSGGEVLSQACHYAMEGIVAKKCNSLYVSRRSDTWLKIKCLHHQEFVIAGYTQPAGERNGFGALLLGYYEGKDLVYCGRVGTGFTEASLRDLTRRLHALETDECPYARSPARSQLRGVTWIEPKLVAEISYAMRTDEGLLRHAVFHGLREDKPARQVVFEKPVSRPKGERTRAASSDRNDHRAEPTSNRKRAAASKAARTSGLAKRKVHKQSVALAPSQASEMVASRISHPERIVYQEPELTKLDIAKYFLDVAPWMLPGVVGRPITMLRCPGGSQAQCFYQKHFEGELPEGISPVEIEEDTKRATYGVVDDARGLLSLAQINVLEVHLWPALADDVEHPDRMVFDLDPGEGVQWPWVVEGARDIRKLLKQVGIESFVRTSGGKGLHVVAPFNRESGDWDRLKNFASVVAHTLAAQHPDRYIATMSKAQRRGKVFIDYLRNQRGATAIASFSPRARVGAGVATPVSWRELNDELTNDDFTVETILKRLTRKSKDPWEGFDDLDQSLPTGDTTSTTVHRPSTSKNDSGVRTSSRDRTRKSSGKADAARTRKRSKGASANARSSRKSTNSRKR